MAACEPAQIVEAEGIPISFRRIGTGKRKILFFHGFPGSSAQIELFRPCLEKYDLDVFCVDRPGYHRSKAGSGSQFEEATRMVQRVLAQTGWSSFEAISVSGGTPFLFALVRSLAPRVSRVTIISGLGPVTTEGFEGILGMRSRLALRALPLVPGEWLKKAVTKRNDNGSVRRSELLRFFLPISKPDEAAMREPFTRDVLGQAIAEAFLQNGIGPKRDARIFLSPWKLDMGTYEGTVDIWHGTDDLILPPAMAERVSESLARSKLRLIPKEGHYSLAIHAIGEILAASQ